MSGLKEGGRHLVLYVQRPYVLVAGPCIDRFGKAVGAHAALRHCLGIQKTWNVLHVRHVRWSRLANMGMGDVADRAWAACGGEPAAGVASWGKTAAIGSAVMGNSWG
jgi:hypothetical protein